MNVPPPQVASSAELFVLELGRALHTAGTPADRLEDALAHVTRRLALEAHVFSTPTALMVAFGPLASQRTHLLRVSPADVDLDHLDRLDGVARRVTRGELSPEGGIAAIEVICGESRRLGILGLLATHVVMAAAWARLFGGGLAEVAIAALIGLLVGALSVVWPRVTTGAPVLELLASVVASFLSGAAAVVLAHWQIPVSVYVATLAGVVALLPGFSLTVAVTELATRNLASGTARVTAAGMTLLQMAVGVALGERLATTVLGPVAAIAPDPLPAWTEVVALALSPFVVASFTRAPRRHLFAVLVVSVIGYGAARLGGDVLGRELGAFVGAFAVGLVSRIHAARQQCPQMITLVPAILLLVPGSFGFRSVSSFLGADVTSGIDAAMKMMLIAMAIAAGLLVAQAPGRRRASL